MLHSDLADKLRERLAILLDVDSAAITDGTGFADLGVDSMMRLELVAIVEQHVGYEIPEQELPNLGTIEAVLGYVAREQ